MEETVSPDPEREQDMSCPRTSSRPVNINTSYTGVAGLHSEVSASTAAKTKAFDRRTSNIMNTEQAILSKQMNTFGSRRKSLEHSMLAYSKKMKAILENRTTDSEHPRKMYKSAAKMKSKITLSPRPYSDSVSAKRPNILPLLEEISTDVPLGKVSHVPVSKTIRVNQNSTDHNGRVSIDSGISSDLSESGSFGDSENPLQTFLEQEKNAHNRSDSRSSVLSTQSETQDFTQNSTRRRRERRSRLGAGSIPELPTVADTETPESCEKFDNMKNIQLSIDIAPFPDRTAANVVIATYLPPTTLAKDPEEEDKKTRTLNPLVNTTNWTNRDINAQKPPIPMSRPRAVNSPSVASTRLRARRGKKAKGGKIIHHTFHYSDYVENAISGRQSYSSDDDMTTLSKSSSLTQLNDIDFDERREDELKRLFDELTPGTTPRQRRASLPSRTSQQSLFDSELKSILRSTDTETNDNNDNKTVRFQLPDVLRQTKTSR